MSIYEASITNPKKQLESDYYVKGLEALLKNINKK